MVIFEYTELTHVFIYTCMFMRIFSSMFLNFHEFLYAYMYMCTCVRMHLYSYVGLYVCLVYMYVQMYAQMYAFKRVYSAACMYYDVSSLLTGSRRKLHGVAMLLLRVVAACKGALHFYLSRGVTDA